LNFSAACLRPLAWLSLSAAIALPLTAFACRSPERSPTGPTTNTSQVTASVESIPVSLRTQIGGLQGAAYQVAVDVTFRETGGIAGRITRIDVAVVDRNGERGTRSLEVAIDVAARGMARQRLAETVSVRSGREPVRLSISGAGMGETGRPFNVQSAEVPVAMEGAPSFPDAVLVGAGDIADCGANAEATARLLDRIAGAIFAAGDLVYPNGTPDRFAACYEPTWGRHRARTFPAPGNHDWEISAGGPYFDYFGPAAGPRGLGYYSFDLGDWHILSLNSNIAATAGSPQFEWVRRDLADRPSQCSLAIWHHPLFSSGEHGNNPVMREMWRLLDSLGVDIVLTGHEHGYERFAPQDADGRGDPLGIRQFVVATGGVPLYRTGVIKPNSEVREQETWGVLKLMLRTSGYDWEFVPIEGQSFRDVGGDVCRP
jgi:hypothetical protein